MKGCYADNGRVGVDLTFDAVDMGVAFADLGGVGRHVEDCCFGTSSLERVVLSGGGFQRRVVPFHGNDLIVADIVVCFIHASSEPIPTTNFFYRCVLIVIFLKFRDECVFALFQALLLDDIFYVRKNDVHGPIRISSSETFMFIADVDAFGRVFALLLDRTTKAIRCVACCFWFSRFPKVLAGSRRGD